MKTFCIGGPIRPEEHYYIPKRLNWSDLDKYLAQKFYFLLHAPRQSGKTTAILEYVNYLNADDKYIALYLSTEAAHSAKNDVERALFWLLSQFETQISIQLPDQLKAREFLLSVLGQPRVPEDSFYRFLKYWAEISSKPVVIFFDEIDGLVENTLISLLKQFRTGYTNRSAHFPQSICLIGVRDLQDYKLKSKDEEEKGILFSPFNIISETLILKNFTEQQVAELYRQHTVETGQVFTDEAISHAHYLTGGQPWLTNALAYQACFVDVTDRSFPITKDIVDRAKEQIIRRRDTHISSLVDRLNDPRVRPIIDALISGSLEPAFLNPDNIQYVRDLGLLKEDSLELANPIYEQIIPRALTHVIQELIPHQIAWYIDSSGKLSMTKLLLAFTQWFREHATAYGEILKFHEGFPHLLLYAFLQRIINGGGQVHREPCYGNKRPDLDILWKQQRFIIELKIKRSEETRVKGLEQLAQYLDYCDSAEGHLILVDPDPKKSWEEKISQEQVEINGIKIHLWTL